MEKFGQVCLIINETFEKQGNLESFYVGDEHCSNFTVAFYSFPFSISFYYGTPGLHDRPLLFNHIRKKKPL